MAVAGYHFYPCHCILPLIKVEVQSGIFRAGVKEILESMFYFSNLALGSKRGLDWRRPRRKGIAYHRLQ